MLPVLVREPFRRDGWVYEEKVDGWRMLAFKAGRSVRLESRNVVDHTRRFPDLAAAVAALSGRTPTTAAAGPGRQRRWAGRLGSRATAGRGWRGGWTRAAWLRSTIERPIVPRWTAAASC